MRAMDLATFERQIAAERPAEIAAEIVAGIDFDRSSPYGSAVRPDREPIPGRPTEGTVSTTYEASFKVGTLTYARPFRGDRWDRVDV